VPLEDDRRRREDAKALAPLKGKLHFSFKFETVWEIIGVC